MPESPLPHPPVYPTTLSTLIDREYSDLLPRLIDPTLDESRFHEIIREKEVLDEKYRSGENQMMTGEKQLWQEKTRLLGVYLELRGCDFLEGGLAKTICRLDTRVKHRKEGYFQEYSPPKYEIQIIS